MSRLKVKNKYGKVEYHELEGNEIEIGGSGSMDIQLKGLKGHQITIYHQDEEYEIEAQTQNSLLRNGKPMKQNKLYDLRAGDQYKIEGFKLYLDQALESKKKNMMFDELGATVAIDQEVPEIGAKQKNKAAKFSEFATTLAVNSDQEENSDRRVPAKGAFSELGATVQIPDQDDGEDGDGFLAPAPPRSKKEKKPKFNEYATTLAIEDDDGFLVPPPRREKKKEKPRFDQYATTLAIDEQEEEGDGFLAPLPQIKKKQPKQEKKKFNELAPTVGLPELDPEFEEEIKQKRKKKEKPDFSQLGPTIAIEDDKPVQDINLSGDTLPIEQMEANEVISPKSKPQKREKKEVKKQEEKKPEVKKPKQEEKKAPQRYIKRNKKQEMKEEKQLVDEIFGLGSADSDNKYAKEMKKAAAAPVSKVIESDEEEEEVKVEKKVEKRKSEKRATKKQVDQEYDKKMRSCKLRIAVSGVSNRNKLTNMIFKIGAKLIGRTDQEFDLLVLEKPTKTAKVMIAIAREKPIVSTAWLEDSVGAKKQLPYDDYFLDWSAHLKPGKTELPKKKPDLFQGSKVYVHSYLRAEDRADKAGVVPDVEEVVKATNGKLVKNYEKADYCIFPEKYKPEKKCAGKIVTAADLREAIFNGTKI